jgi:diaminopimelate epimerase
MQQIGDVIQKHPDISEAVNMYFSQVRKEMHCGK